jgi:hypothetical protein
MGRMTMPHRSNVIYQINVKKPSLKKQKIDVESPVTT